MQPKSENVQAFVQCEQLLKCSDLSGFPTLYQCTCAQCNISVRIFNPHGVECMSKNYDAGKLPGSSHYVYVDRMVLIRK